MNKKIKIFLGGYVNFPNAQNVNCDNIAKCLDKDKFEVHTMYTSMMPIDKQTYQKQDIHLHKVISHRYIWYWMRWWVMRFGRYDIYYLPKGESVDRAFMKKYKTRLGTFITSVEGVITKYTNNTEEYKEYHMDMPDTFFAISRCIAESIKKFWNVDVPVLPLGTVEHSCQLEPKQNIQSIIWVGNIKSNKRPEYLVTCAKQFPDLSFTMVGDGDMQEEIRESCKKQNIKNITFTGRIPNSDVYTYMEKSDLLLMTSEFEGLPKVIQEAAQCGLPSIYINENYSVDFIEDGVNGYSVPNLEVLVERIHTLIEEPQKYQQMSANALETIQAYTWKNLIKKYEAYFTEQYQKKRGKK